GGADRELPVDGNPRSGGSWGAVSIEHSSRRAVSLTCLVAGAGDLAAVEVGGGHRPATLFLPPRPGRRDPWRGPAASPRAGRGWGGGRGGPCCSWPRGQLDVTRGGSRRSRRGRGGG